MVVVGREEGVCCCFFHLVPPRLLWTLPFFHPPSRHLRQRQPRSPFFLLVVPIQPAALMSSTGICAQRETQNVIVSLHVKAVAT